MAPSGPVVATIAADVVLMLYSVIGKGIVQCLATQVKEALCLFSTLPDEKRVDLSVYLRLLQEVLQRILRIGITSAKDAEIGKQVE